MNTASESKTLRLDEHIARIRQRYQDNVMLDAAEGWLRTAHSRGSLFFMRQMDGVEQLLTESQPNVQLTGHGIAISEKTVDKPVKSGLSGWTVFGIAFVCFWVGMIVGATLATHFSKIP
jgi:hypothetical protein